MKYWTNELTNLNACHEAVEWCRGYKSLAAAWKACTRGDWMLWLIGKLEPSDPWSEERKPIVRIALDCAHLVPWRENEYMLARIWCLAALERWLSGDADRDEVIAAAYAAYAAASAAYAASYASYAAAAYADAAYSSATYAAPAYADAASYAASYVASVTDATRAEVLSAAADIVRSHHPRAPKMRG